MTQKGTAILVAVISAVAALIAAGINILPSYLKANGSTGGKDKPDVDGGPSPREDRCVAMTGKWTGEYYVSNLKGHKNVKHTLKGMIWGSERECLAKFTIKWWKYEATEQFHVEFKGEKVSFVGYKVKSKVPVITDQFHGTIRNNYTSFTGFMLDEKQRSADSIILKRTTE